MLRNRIAWYAAFAVVLGAISPAFADEIAARSIYGEWWFYAIAPIALDLFGGVAGIAVAASIYTLQFFAVFMLADALLGVFRFNGRTAGA